MSWAVDAATARPVHELTFDGHPSTPGHEVVVVPLIVSVEKPAVAVVGAEASMSVVVAVVVAAAAAVAHCIATG